MLMISGLKLQQNGKLEQFYNDDKSEVSEVVKTTLPVVLSFSLICIQLVYRGTLSFRLTCKNLRFTSFRIKKVFI